MENPKSRILIVEDEVLIAARLEHILDNLDYDVVGMIASGEEALQLIEETPPDLVLMDINLAGELDGIETATQIRERFDIPVVYLTGYTEEMVLQQAKTTEPFGYIAKPVRERELRATIEMALYRHQLEARLKESEERYRLLVEQPIEGIMMVQDRRIVFANQAFTEMLGYSIEELYAMSPEEALALGHPDDQERREQYHRDRLAGKPVPERYASRYIRKDGAVRWMETAAHLTKYQGEPAVQAFFLDVTERKRTEERLEATLREKDVLLEEIHHRVKNNFAVIYGLLDIQACYVQDEQSLEVFRDSQHRIQTMALIHEQLYSTPDLAQIDFTDYVYTLVAELFATYRVNLTHPVEPKLNVHDVFLEIEQAIPCGMIINELVSNALKYAFPNTGDWPPDFVGEVYVTFHPTDEGKYELTVSDNGVGLPADFRLPSQDTLGLFLIDRFVEQLRGTVEWQGDDGTTCRIMFARQ